MKHFIQFNAVEQTIIYAAISLGGDASVQPLVALLKLMVGEMAINLDSANRRHP